MCIRDRFNVLITTPRQHQQRSKHAISPPDNIIIHKTMKLDETCTEEERPLHGKRKCANDKIKNKKIRNVPRKKKNQTHQ